MSYAWDLQDLKFAVNPKHIIPQKWGFEMPSFAGEIKAKQKAKKIAKHLSDEKNFLSHARRVDVAELETIGVRVRKLATEKPKIQDAVKQLHLAVMATLDATGAVKIFENSQDDVLIRMVNVQVAPNSR